MYPTDFDHLAQTLATGASRRQVLRALGAMLAASASDGFSTRTAAQSETPTPAAEPRPEFPPIYVSPDPIPVGFGDFLIDGNIVPLDLEAVGRLEGTPAVPILAGEETVYIDPSALLSETAVSTPTADGAASTIRRIDESICGGDDSQDVELYLGNLGVSKEFVAASQRPVGNIQWNANLHQLFVDPGNVNARRWCSGTLITEDLFLTAAHCFAQRPGDWRVPRINGTNEPISRTEIALNMHVDFEYQLDPFGVDRDPVSFPVIELVEDRLGGLDYAIVRLANNPGLVFGLAKIAPADVQVGETVCIIGHPEGVPKRIEAGPATQIEDVRIFYDDIDTAGGSSGSGIVASPGGPLVGIHTNGGCDDVAFRNNHGVAISALLRASPTLSALATSGGA